LLLANDWQPYYRLERCEFGNLHAVDFIVYRVLRDGVSSSNIIDGFGKSVDKSLCARVVDLPPRLVAMEDQRRVVAQKRKVVVVQSVCKVVL
jgi:hypothetical protein